MSVMYGGVSHGILLRGGIYATNGSPALHSLAPYVVVVSRDERNRFFSNVLVSPVLTGGFPLVGDDDRLLVVLDAGRDIIGGVVAVDFIAPASRAALEGAGYVGVASVGAMERINEGLAVALGLD